MWSEYFPSHCAAVSPIEGRDHRADNATEDLELVFIMVITTDVLQSSKDGASKYYSLDKKEPNNEIAMRAAEKGRFNDFRLYVQVHRCKIMKRL